MTLRIISWDVGVTNLAYCILEIIDKKNSSNDKSLLNNKSLTDDKSFSNNKSSLKVHSNYKIEIVDWDIIDLIENDRITMKCCGKKKSKSKSNTESDSVCGKNAKYSLRLLGNNIIGFCKTHLVQHTEYFDLENIKNLFVENINENINNSHKCYTCTYIQKTGNMCGKKANYAYSDELINMIKTDDDNKSDSDDDINIESESDAESDAKSNNGSNANPEESFFCSTHYKSELNKKIKKYSPQLIKKVTSKDYTTAELQLCLINKLDSLASHFSKLNISEVIIENQPALKRPGMKSIANTLFDYFLIRGYVDRSLGLHINLVKFMAACNKLKVNNDNTLEVFKKNKESKKKYKLTKELGIQYTKQLLSHDPMQLEYLDLFSKKDDLCDAYLQGRYYLEIYRKKNIVQINKTKKKNKTKKNQRNMMNAVNQPNKLNHGPSRTSGSKTIKNNPRNKSNVKSKSKPKAKSNVKVKIITI